MYVHVNHRQYCIIPRPTSHLSVLADSCTSGTAQLHVYYDIHVYTCTCMCIYVYMHVYYTCPCANFTHIRGLELSEEDHHTAGEGGKRPERDSVVQLLEAEVRISGLAFV